MAVPSLISGDITEPRRTPVKNPHCMTTLMPAYGQIGRVCPHVAKSAESVRIWPDRQSVRIWPDRQSLSAYGQIGRVCPHMARSAESVRIWPDRQSLSACGQIGRVCPHMARSAESVRMSGQIGSFINETTKCKADTTKPNEICPRARKIGMPNETKWKA